MSATAHRLDEYFWNTKGEDNLIQFIKADIYGKDIKFKLNVLKFDGIERVKIKSNDTIIIAETRRSCITYGVEHENDDYYFIHALFAENERADKLKYVLEHYGKTSSISSRKPLIGTQILGYALDITTNTEMFDFTTSPDTTIQRGGGRVARFGIENNEIPVYNVCIDTSVRNHKIVSDTYDMRLWEKWINYLSVYSGKVITRGELYELYDKFIEDNKGDYMLMFYKKFNSSSDKLSGMMPYKTFRPIDDENKSLPTAKMTFRGDNSSVYVAAYDNNGNVSSPIIIDKERISMKAKPNEYNPEARKAQYNYFVERLGKEDLLYLYGVKDKEKATRNGKTFDDAKFDIARHERAPLLLLNARYSSKIGLVLKYDNSDEDDY
jgi:hypothetical protein